MAGFAWKNSPKTAGGMQLRRTRLASGFGDFSPSGCSRVAMCL
jgi:hypothetical protein